MTQLLAMKTYNLVQDSAAVDENLPDTVVVNENLQDAVVVDKKM